MSRLLAGVTADLVVEASREGESFRGRVIAVALDDGGQSGLPAPDATWLLVADDHRPAPVWIAQADVTAQRLGR